MGIIKIEDFTVKGSHKFLFDANIWLFINGPLADVDLIKQKRYSRLFDQILSRNSEIHITSMIISEIANVVIRDRHKTYQQKTGDFLKYKDYWKTPNCKSSIEEIKIIIQSISDLDCVLQQNDRFDYLKLNDNIFDRYGKLDFNDSYIAQASISNNCFLVTDDSDFGNEAELNIIK